jgi:hypothetical protein
MAKTVSSLAEELATEAGEQYGDYDITRQFDAWVSEVAETITGAEKWPFLMGLVELLTSADARTYELGSSQGDITAIQKQDESRTLEYLSREDLLRRGVDLLSTGEPKFWYYDELSDDAFLTVALWPVPDATYLYWAHRERTTAQLDEVDDTVIPLPADFLPAVREGVRGYYRESIGDSRGATAAWGRFAEKLRALRSRYLTPRGQRRVMQITDLSPRASFALPRLPSNY